MCKCIYWDTPSLSWSGAGCVQAGVVETGPDTGFVICNCTHLTSFSSQLDQTLSMASEVITSVAGLTLSQVLRNSLILVVLLIVYAVIIVACVYGRYLDQLDDKFMIQVRALENERGIPVKGTMLS